MGVRIPTPAQMKDPSLVPAGVKEALKKVPLTDVNPLNLYRITWKNDPETGLRGELP